MLPLPELEIYSLRLRKLTSYLRNIIVTIISFPNEKLSSMEIIFCLVISC